MLQFVLDAPHCRQKTLEDLSLTQLVLAMVSIQATSFVATNVVLDLLARQEYIEPLRAEVEQAFEEGGGRLSKKSLARMSKLDSFLKGSQRLMPSQYSKFDNRF